MLVHKNGLLVLEQVLHPDKKLGQNLGAWPWTMDGKTAQYRALYPQAWTTYTFKELALRLVCQQVIPTMTSLTTLL